MERNEKIVVIATAAIAAGSTAVFAIAKFRKNRAEKATATDALETTIETPNA